MEYFAFNDLNYKIIASHGSDSDLGEAIRLPVLSLEVAVHFCW